MHWSARNYNRKKWKSCDIHWSAWSYNIGDSEKVADMHWSALSYNKEESGKVAVCFDEQEVITKENVEKLRYEWISMKLYQRRKGKSCGIHWSAWSYNKEEKKRSGIHWSAWSYTIGENGKFTIGIDDHEVITKEKVAKLRYALISIKI